VPPTSSRSPTSSSPTSNPFGGLIRSQLGCNPGMTTELLREIPMFPVGTRVKIAKPTRHGPSYHRCEKPVYETVSHRYDNGFIYVLKNTLTGEMLTHEVSQRWLRKAI
jgi:hypothetical protein